MVGARSFGARRGLVYCGGGTDVWVRGAAGGAEGAGATTAVMLDLGAVTPFTISSFDRNRGSRLNDTLPMVMYPVGVSGSLMSSL